MCAVYGKVWSWFGRVTFCCAWGNLVWFWGVNMCCVWNISSACLRIDCVLCMGQFDSLCRVSLCCVWDSLFQVCGE